ncbi:MAG: helix-turn-helix transcriptional regulator [Candidatus Thermoplasmatota archaeon]|nr:helix-turn-helix transcriptional regulator [Candidatus Thermoplasmatota archaeon]
MLSEWSKELKKGSLQLCLLGLLKKEKKYGFQIIKELGELSNGYFDLKEGTLYPALHRLEQKGYLASEWVVEEGNVPRRYYKLTKEGETALEKIKGDWQRMVKSCKNVLEGKR